MSMESFEASSEPSEPIARTVSQALPEGMEDKTYEEKKSAVKILDKLVTLFKDNEGISRHDHVFAKKSEYVTFVKKATELGLPTRFINSYLETRGIKLSQAAPSVLRPKLNLTSTTDKVQKKKVRLANNATVAERIAKTDVAPAQQDMFDSE